MAKISPVMFLFASLPPSFPHLPSQLSLCVQHTAAAVAHAAASLGHPGASPLPPREAAFHVLPLWHHTWMMELVAGHICLYPVVSMEEAVLGGAARQRPGMVAGCKAMMVEGGCSCSTDRVVCFHWNVSGQKWNLDSDFTHSIMITWTTWDKRRRAGNSSFSYIQMKTKQSQQFNHWGQKGLRKIPILSLPLRFLYKALGSSLKRPSTSPSKWSFLFLFSLTYTYIFISVYTHTRNQAPNPPELHLFLPSTHLTLH